MKLLGHHLVVPLPGGALLMRKRSAVVGAVLLVLSLVALFAAHWLGAYPISANRIVPLFFSGGRQCGPTHPSGCADAAYSRWSVCGRSYGHVRRNLSGTYA